LLYPSSAIDHMFAMSHMMSPLFTINPTITMVIRKKKF